VVVIVFELYSFCVVCPLCLCSFVCCVLFECGMLFCVMCVICVLRLILVSLSPGKTPFAVKINNNKLDLYVKCVFQYGAYMPEEKNVSQYLLSPLSHI
jgi:hypothetical protein